MARTVHKQVRIVLDNEYLFNEPFPIIQCDEEIAPLIYQLNCIGAETEESCFYDTELEGSYVTFTEKGYRSLLQLAYVEFREGDEYRDSTLYEFLQAFPASVIAYDDAAMAVKGKDVYYNDTPPAMVNLSYVYNIFIPANLLSQFNNWIEEIHENFPDN